MLLPRGRVVMTARGRALLSDERLRQTVLELDPEGR
jgi:hypothetical protein